MHCSPIIKIFRKVNANSFCATLINKITRSLNPVYGFCWYGFCTYCFSHRKKQATKGFTLLDVKSRVWNICGNSFCKEFFEHKIRYFSYVFPLSLTDTMERQSMFEAAHAFAETMVALALRRLESDFQISCDPHIRRSVVRERSYEIGFQLQS